MAGNGTEDRGAGPLVWWFFRCDFRESGSRDLVTKFSEREGGLETDTTIRVIREILEALDESWRGSQARFSEYDCVLAHAGVQVSQRAEQGGFVQGRNGLQPMQREHPPGGRRTACPLEQVPERAGPGRAG